MARPKIKKDLVIETYKDLPIGTYGDALLLTETLEGWRTKRPVIDLDKCIDCKVCYLVCPEGVIHEFKERCTIDYRFCKGCGICSQECIAKCIQMVKEEK
jgi:pyruvate ferredoxin oxidoreductase delta subunit